MSIGENYHFDRNFNAVFCVLISTQRAECNLRRAVFLAGNFCPYLAYFEKKTLQ